MIHAVVLVKADTGEYLLDRKYGKIDVDGALLSGVIAALKSFIGEIIEGEIIKAKKELEEIKLKGYRIVFERSPHTYIAIIPDFAAKVTSGDIIVAGHSFGCGNSREEAVLVLKHLGIGAVIAESFSRIFFRNAINLGLPAIECKNITKKVEDGHELEVYLDNGLIKNLTTGETLKASSLPDFLLEIIKAGGTINILKKRFKQ